MLFALVISFDRWRVTKGIERRIIGLRCIGRAGIACGLFLYGASKDLILDWLEIPAMHAFEIALIACGLAVLGCALSYSWAIETASHGIHHWGAVADEPTHRRIANRGYRSLAIALAAVSVVALNIGASERAFRFDLRFIKVGQPHQSTYRMVHQLEQEVRAILLYPEENEVAARLRPYFDALRARNPLLRVEQIDHALVPQLVREHQFAGNGMVVLLREETQSTHTEVIEIGQELAHARNALRTLDSRFQEALSRLIAPEKEIYFTVGHAERVGQQRFLQVLQRANISVHELGIAHHAAQEISRSVPLLCIVGPRETFSREEVDSIFDYMRRGGRLLVMLDHQARGELDILLRRLGVELEEGVVSSAQHFIPRTRTRADHQRVYTTNFSDHPIVRRALTHPRRNAVVLHESVALSVVEPAQEGVRVVFPLRTEESTWRDQNGDFVQNELEEKASVLSIAAVTLRNRAGREGRAVIIGDGSFSSDEQLHYRGNNLVLRDSLRWLWDGLEEEKIVLVDPLSSEEDVPIEHTHEEDVFFFYGTSFGVPAVFFVWGWFVSYRRKQRRK